MIVLGNVINKQKYGVSKVYFHDFTSNITNNAQPFKFCVRFYFVFIIKIRNTVLNLIIKNYFNSKLIKTSRTF